MKKRIFGILGALIMLIALPASALAEEIPSAVSRAAESAVRLTVKTSFGTEQITGIMVGKGKEKKYVITILRAIEGHTENITAGYTDEQNIGATLIASDKQENLALLELKEDIPEAKQASLRDKPLNDGDKIYAIDSRGHKDSANISEGTVLSRNKLTADGISTEIYQITIKTDAHLNGGMLVTENGSLAGICYYDGNTDINKAITEKALLKLLDDNEIKYKKSTLLYLIIILVCIAALVAAGAFALFRAIKSKKENMPGLMGVSGDFAGQKIPVKAESINIGRDAKCCQIVILHDNDVSRCHCSIRYDNIKHCFVLTDLSSTHGTYINGEKLEPNTPRYIGAQTVFCLGNGQNSFRTVEGGTEI